MTVGFNVSRETFKGGMIMNKIQSFYSNGKEILGFLILVLIFNMIFDTKTTEKFVLLVLFSMCIINADKFIEFMKSNFGGNGSKENSTELSDSRNDAEWQEQNKGKTTNRYLA